jgi:hypothetical protein
MTQSSAAALMANRVRLDLALVMMDADSLESTRRRRLRATGSACVPIVIVCGPANPHSPYSKDSAPFPNGAGWGLRENTIEKRNINCVELERSVCGFGVSWAEQVLGTPRPPTRCFSLKLEPADAGSKDPALRQHK